MATDALTPFLGLTKPTVNDPAGEDLWGQKLNTNFDKLDLFASQQGALNEAPQNDKVYGRGTPYAWIEVPFKEDYDALVVNVEENTSAIDGLETTVAGQVEEAPDDGQAYARKSKTWSVVSLVVTWGDVQGKPATFPPTLPIPSSGVTGLDAKQTSQDTAINGKEPTIAAGTVSDFWRGDKSWQPLSSITVDAWTKAQSDARYEPLDSAYTKAEGDARYEPTITAGTTAQYWRGDKQWATFPPALGLVSVGDTPPGTPLDNQLYWKSNDGSFWIRFNDGTGPSQWIQVNAPPVLSTSFMMWPAGAGVEWWGPTAPPGTRFCDGSAISRTTFAALFDVIGTTYGVGDGSTTFNLPDVRGRATAGKDNMGGTAANRLTNTGTGNPGIAGATLGAAGGVDRHALTVAQLPSHEHQITVSNSTSIAPTGGGLLRSAATATVTGFATFTGGNEAHPNTQPTIVCNKLITTGGVA